MTVYKNYAYKHGVGWSIWHLEWVTKYRRKVFQDEQLQKLCEIAFEEAAKRYNLSLEECEVQPEHVHLIVHLRPSMSPSKAVGLLKGYSARLLFLQAENKLRKWYWLPAGKRSLWGDGKFMAYVGHITLEKAKEYIKNQKAHHANFRESPPFRVGVIQFCEHLQEFQQACSNKVRHHMGGKGNCSGGIIVPPDVANLFATQWEPTK